MRLGGVPRAQRRAIRQPLSDFEQRYARNEGMARAYLIRAAFDGGDSPIFRSALFDGEPRGEKL